jgi:hypothetical protein
VLLFADAYKEIVGLDVAMQEILGMEVFDTLKLVNSNLPLSQPALNKSLATTFACNN